MTSVTEYFCDRCNEKVISHDKLIVFKIAQFEQDKIDALLGKPKKSSCLSWMPYEMPGRKIELCTTCTLLLVNFLEKT